MVRDVDLGFTKTVYLSKFACLFSFYGYSSILSYWEQKAKKTYTQPNISDNFAVLFVLVSFEIMNLCKKSLLQMA